MPINYDIPGIETYGKGRGRFNLPCGFVDASGNVHNYVIMREINGYDEDIMGDEAVDSLTRVTNLLVSCCEQLGDVKDKDVIARAVSGNVLDNELPLIASDRLAMLMFLRIVSVGDTYNFSRKCEHCNHINKGFIDLTKTKIEPIKDPTKRKVSVTLPSGKKAVIAIADATSERGMMEAIEKGLDSKSIAIMARLKMVDGEPVTQDTVKSLGLKDRAFITTIYTKIETFIDTKVEFTCINCKKDNDFTMDFGQNFFSSPEVEDLESQIEWV